MSAPPKKRTEGRSALDLIEEAVHLARRAPLSAWLAYYAGSAPFVLGLLYFWSDMTRGAYAHDHVVGAALLLALGFVWMKGGQSVCATSLSAMLAETPPPRWTVKRLIRTAIVQAALSPWGLIVRPVALLITVPYGWVFAAYQNIVILGNGETSNSRAVSREAIAQARLWPRQNHEAIFILFAFGFVVWINVASAMLLAPMALKSLLGIETMFSKSAWSLLNTTFFAAVCGVTYLCVDPLFKAFYVVRCFYGGSLRSGEDLRIELRRLTALRSGIAAAIALAFAFSPARGEDVAPENPPPSQQTVEPARLDRQIDRVLEHPRFAWRLPREAGKESDKGIIGGFIEGIGKSLRDLLRPVGQWFRGVLDRLGEWLNRRSDHQSQRDFDFGDWMGTAEVALYVLIAIAVVAILILLWRRWRLRRRREVVVAETVAVMPDLTSEDVTANQLPEDEWMRMARDLVSRGELRLAFRAFYLAGLAHLGQQQLVTVARHKSNMEYERELSRRARARTELLTAFQENRAAFERVWYGDHAATTDGLGVFRTNLDRILAP